MFLIDYQEISAHAQVKIILFPRV